MKRVNLHLQKFNRWFGHPNMLNGWSSRNFWEQQLPSALKEDSSMLVSLCVWPCLLQQTLFSKDSCAVARCSSELTLLWPVPRGAAKVSGLFRSPFSFPSLGSTSWVCSSLSALLFLSSASSVPASIRWSSLQRRLKRSFRGMQRVPPGLMGAPWPRFSSRGSALRPKRFTPTTEVGAAGVLKTSSSRSSS